PVRRSTQMDCARPDRRTVAHAAYPGCTALGTRRTLPPLRSWHRRWPVDDAPPGRGRDCGCPAKRIGTRCRMQSWTRVNLFRSSRKACLASSGGKLGWQTETRKDLRGNERSDLPDV